MCPLLYPGASNLIWTRFRIRLGQGPPLCHGEPEMRVSAAGPLDLVLPRVPA
jgi:hypothetical protein